MLHDIDHLISRKSKETGGDLVMDAIFTLPFPQQKWWLPYLHFGGAFNLNGKTNQMYTGLHWNLYLTKHLFIEAGGGMAVHDGYLYDRPRVDTKHNLVLGCRFLFRQIGTIGITLSEHIDWLINVTHISNAGLCPENEGLTNFGFQLQYKF